MRSSFKHIPFIIAIALTLFLSFGSVHAKESGRESFELEINDSKGASDGFVSGRDKNGWTSPEQEFKVERPKFVDIQIVAGSFDRGAFSFDLMRLPGNHEKQGSVFALHDGAGEQLMLVQIIWGSDSDSESKLFLSGSDFTRNGLGLWKQTIVLNRLIAPKKWVHFDLAWNDVEKYYELFLDGQPQNAANRYSLDSMSNENDYRQRDTIYKLSHGLEQIFFDKPFSQLMKKAALIRIGVNYNAGQVHGSSPLSNAIIDNFSVIVDEDVKPVTRVDGEGYDVQNLSGFNTKKGIILAWNPPEIRGVNQGYLVYRRSGEGRGRFEKLTHEKIYDIQFVDETVKKDETYRYSVTTVYDKLESKYPPEISVAAAVLSIESVAADKQIYGADQKIIATLRGASDKKASFKIEQIVENQPMEEVDDGVYVGEILVPYGLNIESAAMVGTLSDLLANETATASGGVITIDSIPPESVPNIIADSPWEGEIEISFDASPSQDVDHYLVYRGEGKDPTIEGGLYDETKELKYIDAGVIAGLEYRYTVAPVDKAGNIGLLSEVASATLVQGSGPTITGVTVDPSLKPMKPGEIATITVTGQGDSSVEVDIGELVLALSLTEEGRSGKYVGSYAVREEDVGQTKNLHRIVIRLTDAYGGTTLAGPELAIIGEDGLNDKTPPAIFDVTHDAFQVAGFSGKLVGGNILTATMEGEPGCYGSFDIDGVVEGAPMEEAAPGVYKGYYTVGLKDQGAETSLTGVLTDDAGNQTRAVAKKTIDFDSRIRLFVTASQSNLPADRKSEAQIIVRAEDANGDGISGHELSLTLSTTEEYTGVVGGGKIEDRKAAAEDEDDLEVKWGGETDAFGEVKATYTAGFAAKTALVIAKNLTTGDIGAGWLNTYIAATTTIELFPRTQKDKPDEAVLTISADPSKLTADGRSKARIKAILKDLTGAPIDGDEIIFTLAGTNGKLKVLRSGRTNADGLAEAEYRAGKAMGTVTITASVPKRGVTANVKIILMSDAPAKINLVASELRLPADGESTAALSVMVTDINDNPNSQAPVAFSLLQGQGSLAENKLLTDRNGEGENVFKAGNKAGLVVVEARHTSRPPTEEELRRVYGAVFVPRLEERQERDRIKIEEWLVKPGEEVEKGQALATLNSRKGSWTLVARERGVFVRQIRHERDVVELGDSIGYIELDGEVWAEAYGD